MSAPKLTQQRRKVPFTFLPLPRTFSDEWMAEITDAEIRVYIAIARRTLGYSRYADRIPMSFLAEATGLHRTSISRAARQLEARGLIRTEYAKRTATLYEILTPRHLPESGEVDVAPALPIPNDLCSASAS